MAKRQLELRGREVDIADRASKINQFAALAGFLPPGTTLGSLGPAGMTLFGDAFGVPVEGLEDLEVNPETLQTVLNSGGMKILRENPDLLLPSIRAELGLEPDQDIADLRGLQARMTAEALTQITNDPVMKNEFVARTLGREPVTLTIPGRDGAPDRRVSFDGSVAANVYAQFLLAQDRERFDLSIREGDESSGLVEEIQKAVLQGGQGHSVSSSAITGRLIPTYNRAVAAGDLSIVQNYLATASPGEALGMQYLLGSIRAGEETFLQQLRENAPQLANFLEIGNAVREVLGPEQAAEVLPGITEALGGVAGLLRDPLIGGLEFEFGGTTLGAPTGAGTQVLTGGFENVPQDVLIEAAKNLFQSGEQTRQELEEILGPDVVQLALGTQGVTDAGTPPERTEPREEIPQGGYDPSVLPRELQGKGRQLNTLLRRQAVDRQRGLATSARGVDQAVTRLQNEIRAGLTEPDVQFALDAVTLASDEGEIPAGGIKPSSVPSYAQPEVRVLNSLIRRRKGATGRVARDLDGRIANQRTKIQQLIASRATAR
ncbi:MAG: hypothetical protein AB7V18_19210 [Pyrinomonadaceae bacterium]